MQGMEIQVAGHLGQAQHATEPEFARSSMRSARTSCSSRSSIGTQTHQPQQSVGVEHKVGVVRGVVPDDGVHAADLEVGGDDLRE